MCSGRHQHARSYPLSTYACVEIPFVSADSRLFGCITALADVEYWRCSTCVATARQEHTSFSHWATADCNTVTYELVCAAVSNRLAVGLNAGLPRQAMPSRWRAGLKVVNQQQLKRDTVGIVFETVSGSDQSTTSCPGEAYFAAAISRCQWPAKNLACGRHGNIRDISVRHAVGPKATFTTSAESTSQF